MYTPKFNEVQDRAILLEAMHAYSFAVLFGPLDDTIGPAPHQATHLPLVVKDEGPHGVVEGHFAKANSHWQSLANRETLVVFPGPHSYVSPSLYAEELSVPTWTYIAIHAYGKLELVEDYASKETLLSGLIQANEPAFAEQWRGLPDGYRRTCLRASWGFGFRLRALKVSSKSIRTVLKQIAEPLRTRNQAAMMTSERLPAG